MALFVEPWLVSGLQRSCGALYFINEDRGGESNYDGDRADTVVLPGTLALCGDPDVARKGVVLDDRVCAPTVAKYVVSAAADAALSDGFAAHEAEQERRVRYGRLAMTAGWCSGDAALSGGALWSPRRTAALARQEAERVLAHTEAL
ncbi:hypothetical protein JKP88DRAFT_276811 [Tribonema minus]|uniref:Uncharacterized protein n=1 Tax=Tribonema minus TaxID=303371 RepID=A0A835Z9P1_9STRA|nr:hypothetical protein JKP88DRAFT_276811 [Tribonema minus]